MQEETIELIIIETKPNFSLNLSDSHKKPNCDIFRETNIIIKDENDRRVPQIILYRCIIVFWHRVKAKCLEAGPVKTGDQQFDRSSHVVGRRINYVVVDKLSFCKNLLLDIVAITYNNTIFFCL